MNNYVNIYNLRMTDLEIFLFTFQHTAEEFNIRVHPFPDAGFGDCRSFVTSESKLVAGDNENEYYI